MGVAQILLLALQLLALVSSTASSAQEDLHHNCRAWAEAGECTANPNYMLQSCAESCTKVMATGPAPDSFDDVAMPDIHGKEVDFAKFRNNVVLVTNVASE